MNVFLGFFLLDRVVTKVELSHFVPEVGVLSLLRATVPYLSLLPRPIRREVSAPLASGQERGAAVGTRNGS